MSLRRGWLHGLREGFQDDRTGGDMVDRGFMTRLSGLLLSALLLSACAVDQASSSGRGPEERLVESAAGAEIGEAEAHAPLFDDLGDHHRPITTRSALAQRYFDQGLRLQYAFNTGEARRSFEQAAALDPTCAMCSWGVALSLGPNINVPRSPERAAAAHAAIEKARRRASSATEVERALIEALARRYPISLAEAAEERSSLDRAYADAMRAVARRFPDDLDVQTLYAESLMNLRPWQLWTRDGKPQTETTEVVRTLERVIDRYPDHPGANHYYIHAMEASPWPERALPSADRLGGLMPGSGHIVHMPSHIYLRVGRYADAALANERAILVDRAYFARVSPDPMYRMYSSHNHHFLSFASLMEGRRAKALDAARDLDREIDAAALHHMPQMEFARVYPLLVHVRYGDSTAILDSPAPPAKLSYATGLWHFARGMAQASLGRAHEAAQSRESLGALHAGIDATAKAGANSAQALLGIALNVLSARIAEAGGDREEATLLLRQAAMAEDDLDYMEPPDWPIPARHLLGAVLLDAGRASEAEVVYREDLRRNRENGWALFGLGQSLRAQGKAEEAARVEARFRKAWTRADVPLLASRF